MFLVNSLYTLEAFQFKIHNSNRAWKHGTCHYGSGSLFVKTRNSTPILHQLIILCMQHPRGWMRKGGDWVVLYADLKLFVFSLNEGVFSLSSFCHADTGFLISRLIFLLVAYGNTSRNISMHDKAKTVYHLIPLFLPELKHSSQQQSVDLGQANQASCTSRVLVCTPANCKRNFAVLKPTTDNAFSL